MASIVRAYLLAPTGGNLQSVVDLPGFDSLVQAVTLLYARLVPPEPEDPFAILQEIQAQKGMFAQGWSTTCEAIVSSSSS
eukprot:CAMPEP_0172464766 /NCGR_PEP_ID=MMETSP1065-20121228/51520_1 /TAXON_ID=265537 /ORGANISM="Amphiprora paludosa, Strain CCMP125" /LENGTH=79 /DNA_ID=CAMNT_0013221103 /DNA_START=9 /DNA_END=251 /DNA_ORIENTATION=+